LPAPFRLVAIYVYVGHRHLGSREISILVASRLFIVIILIQM